MKPYILMNTKIVLKFHETHLIYKIKGVYKSNKEVLETENNLKKHISDKFL